MVFPKVLCEYWSGTCGVAWYDDWLIRKPPLLPRARKRAFKLAMMTIKRNNRHHLQPKIENTDPPQHSPSPSPYSTASLHSTKCYSFPKPKTASIESAQEALDLYNSLATPASLLFDPRYTDQTKPDPVPPFRTYPPSPTRQTQPPTVPSTISIQNLDIAFSEFSMDKRHPSSFQQLEKLGEGTYATVCFYI